MQTRLWKLHPSGKESISCLTPPTYFTSTRFGTPVGPIFDPPKYISTNVSNSIQKQSATMEILSASDDDFFFDDDDMDIDQNNQANTVKTSLEQDFYGSPSSISNSFQPRPIPNGNGPYMDAFVIPIQPRKAPTSKPSTASEFKSTNYGEGTNNGSNRFFSPSTRPTTADQISFAQAKYMSDGGTSRLMTSASSALRYNLRSAATGNTSKEDFMSISGNGGFILTGFKARTLSRESNQQK